MPIHVDKKHMPIHVDKTLQAAIIEGATSIVLQLLISAEYEFNINNMILFTSKYERACVLKFLLEKRQTPICILNRALSNACRSEHYMNIKILIEFGADVNSRDLLYNFNLRINPLEIHNNKLKTLKLLIKNGLKLIDTSYIIFHIVPLYRKRSIKLWKYFIDITGSLEKIKYNSIDHIQLVDHGAKSAIEYRTSTTPLLFRLYKIKLFEPILHQIFTRGLVFDIIKYY